MTTSSPPNKVALVTGSARGIGKAIALRLARDGYDVAINDISAAQAGIDEVVKAVKTLGRKSIGVAADVSDSDATDKMVEDVVSKLGRLDVCIANAGIAHIAPILETTPADRRNMVNVNCEGLMNTYISAAKQMKKQGHSDTYRIIGAASIVSYNTFAMLGSYSASKHFVRGFTQVAAKEWAQYGIRVCAYAPGIVDTSMWEKIDAALGKNMDLDVGQARDKYVEDLVLLKRVSVPEDVAKLVSFMSGPDSEYMTGQTIIVDGGICFA